MFNTDSSVSWIYSQFIAVDANFKLKLKNRQINDPELGSGSFYFVENSAFTRHIEKTSYEEEEVCFFETMGTRLTTTLGHKLWQ